MPNYPYRQCDIDRICEYRQLPTIKKGWVCQVNGESGRIWGLTPSANFAVKFDDGRIRNCHPQFKMKIWNKSGELVHVSDDLPPEEEDEEPNTLDKRIEKARREFEAYPDWVKQNAVFEGGGEQRGEWEDFKSYGNY